MGKKEKLKKKKKEEKERSTKVREQKRGFGVILAAALVILAVIIAYAFFAYSKTTKKYNSRVASVKTNKGTIKIRFFEEDAPVTTANFIKLAREDFYSRTTFFRVVPRKIIQAGDPNTKDSDPQNDGTGGPGYSIPLEIEREKNGEVVHKNIKGSVGMAKSLGDPNSNGSQFYICLLSQPAFDGEYTVFGKVIEGLSVVRRIKKGDVIEKVTITGEVALR